MFNTRDFILDWSYGDSCVAWLTVLFSAYYLWHRKNHSNVIHKPLSFKEKYTNIIISFDFIYSMICKNQTYR